MDAIATLYTSGKQAKALKLQGKDALRQGFSDEAASRRQTRKQMGEIAASMAQAGGGYGGTNAFVLEDSSLNAEMDALNYRYRGTQQGRALRSQAKATKTGGYLLAGAQLMNSASKSQGGG
jgi:hypothetical protein